MSKVGGLVLILAGLGVAAYAMPSALETGEAGPEIEVAKIPAKPAVIASARVAEAAPATTARAAETQPIVAPRPQPAVRPPAPTAAAPALTAPVVVTVARRPGDAPAATPNRSAAIPDRGALARDLQRELKRVGCYDGELNGAWTTSTKRAMKSFTEQVNATLPVEEPDYILLTLVQTHQDRVCGKPCPAAQAHDQDGRCVPSAILARAKKPAQPGAVAAAAPRAAPQPAITGWTTTTAAAPAPLPGSLAPLPEGRMALSGPKAEAPPAHDPLSPSLHPGRQADTPVPPQRVYDRRPPPPRYVSRSRDPNWARNLFSPQGQGRF